MTENGARSGGRRRRSARADGVPVRGVNHRNLRNPFPPMEVFGADCIEAMHQASLQMLEELGIKVLLPEARALFRKGGVRGTNDRATNVRKAILAADIHPAQDGARVEALKSYIAGRTKAGGFPPES